MSDKRWLTPNAPEPHKLYTRRVQMPAAIDFLAPVSGALVELTYPWNWEQDGDLTPEQTAAYYSEIFQSFLPFENEPPEWETPDELDGQPAQPWYEDLADWVIQGFLAITFTPGAAIVYQATVPKLRVAIRTGNLGAFFRVLIGGVEVWTGDSYAPITDILEQVFDTSALTPPYTVRIEHNGIGPNINGTEAKLEVIRESAVAEMIATILRADPGGCGVQWSQDNGDSWNTIDLATCIDALAQSAIQDAIRDGIIAVPDSQQGPQPPPLPGECNTFHVTLAAGNKWVCPVPMSEGDTIRVAGATGGWTDGTVHWFCPDGSGYLAGQCRTDYQSHETGDPLATAYHMAVIGMYATDTFFDPLTAVFTMPAGASDETVVLQANDASLSDNSGEVSFDVEVCTGAWSHIFDFLTDNGGWEFADSGTPYTSWNVGVGWHSNGSGTYAATTIQRTYAETYIYYAAITCTMVAPTANDTEHFGLYHSGSELTPRVYEHFGTCTDHTFTLELNDVSDRLYCDFNASRNDAGCQSYVTRVVVYGRGNNPFV